MLGGWEEAGGGGQGGRTWKPGNPREAGARLSGVREREGLRAWEVKDLARRYFGQRLAVHVASLQRGGGSDEEGHTRG